MGIFPSTSKKASFTLVFLIVSFLVISSGAVIVYEVKKANEGVTGTGLVLLDEGRYIEEGQETDNSNSLVISDKDSSKDSDNYKKPSKDDLKYTGFDSKENSLENNNFVKEDFTEISNQIFSRNGTDYILRDDKEYILASSDAKSSEITFNPALPSSVCVGASGNEKIDIGLQGGFYVSGNSEAYAYCLSLTENKRISATLTLKIMEYDLLSSDDLIATKFLTTYVYCDKLSSGEGYVSYSEIFEDVDLSSQFIGLNDIKIYGLVKLTSYYLNTKTYSTPNYKVSKETTCQCISGSCCDLRSRPYIFKLDGSQPTGYEDDYYCSGTNSPTGTSYCEERDYYCTGSSSSYTWDDSITDTCGLCAYCEEDYDSCFFYYQNEYCGTKDCDYLDVTCRDYHDVDKGCSGGGTCSGPSCDSYTNADPGTSCGTNKECNSDGDCVSVSITCSSSSDCGTDGWVGSVFCSADDVYQEYRTYDCNNSGTSSSSCSSWNQDMKKEECGTAGCSDGVCNTDCHGTYNPGDYNYCSSDCKCNEGEGDCDSVDECATGLICESNVGTNYSWSSDVDVCELPQITCTLDSDCGTDEWVGSAFCSGDDVYQDYRTWACNDAGTTSSTCSYVDTAILKQDCGTASCSDGQCNEIECPASVCGGYCESYSDYPTVRFYNLISAGTGYYFPCSDKTCRYSDYEYCQYGCENGECKATIICSSHSDCGTNSYTGEEFCQNDDSYKNYITYTCNNPGTYSSSCSQIIAPKLIEDCGMSSYGSNYCYNGNVYRDFVEKGCSPFLDFCYSRTTKQKVQDCANGCTEGRCKVEECEEVCSPTKCYEYCVWQ